MKISCEVNSCVWCIEGICKQDEIIIKKDFIDDPYCSSFKHREIFKEESKFLINQLILKL